MKRVCHLAAATAAAVALAATLVDSVMAAPPTGVVQNTTGNNSPTFNNIQGPVSITYGAVDQAVLAKEILRSVESGFSARTDRISRNVHKLLALGDLDRAREAVTAGLRSGRSDVDLIAALKFAEGVLLLVDRQPVAAELAIRAAQALQPGNCNYLAYEAMVLIDLDRMSQASQLVGPQNPHAARCLSAAPVLERAVLINASMLLALQARDAAAVRTKVQDLDLALEQMRAERSNEQMEIKTSMACALARSAVVLDPDSAAASSSRRIRRCLDLNDRLGSAASPMRPIWLAQLSEQAFSEEGEKPPTREERLTAAIQAVSAMKPEPVLGLTPMFLAVHRAELLTRRGLHRLWTLEAPRAAREDYALAYELLLPWIGANRWEIWSAYQDLAGKVVAFNRMYPTGAIADGSLEAIEQKLRLAGTGAAIEDTMDWCETLNILRKLAFDLPNPLPSANALTARWHQCMSSMSDHGTLRYRQQQLQGLFAETDTAVTAGELPRAEAVLTRAMGEAQGLFGYPTRMEMSPETVHRWIQLSGIRTKLDNGVGAEAALRSAEALARPTPRLSYFLGSVRYYLASQVAQGGAARFAEAQQIADDAAAIALSEMRGSDPIRCTSLTVYALYLRLSVQIAQDRGNFADFRSRLLTLADLVPVAPTCTSLAPVVFKLEGKDIDRHKLDALMVASDAEIVKSRLQAGEFSSVNEALVASGMALEETGATFEAKGVMDQFPLFRGVLAGLRASRPAADVTSGAAR